MKKSIINIAVFAIVFAIIVSVFASCDVVNVGTGTDSDTANTTVSDTTDAESTDTTDESAVSDSDVESTIPDTTADDTTAADTTADTTSSDTTSVQQNLTIDDVMAYIGVVTVRDANLAYYTAKTYTEGSDYTIYIYTNLTGSVVRNVYEYLDSDESYEDFKADNLLNASKYNWAYNDDYRLVLVDSQTGYMFNPSSEFDSVVNDSSNHVYYGG